MNAGRSALVALWFLSLALSGCRSASKDPVPLPDATASARASAATVVAPPVSASATASASVSADEPPSPEDMARLREYVIRAQSSGTPVDETRSPEVFAPSMKGTVACEKQRCRAGSEVCVVSPSPGYPAHCEPIASWIGHRTPRPKRGFPALAGITACSGSNNCPPGTVCCLHEIGSAEVQAIVCHADLSECRGGDELCSGAAGECRTPGTKCSGYTCVTS